ncbi:RHS repeat domain-containing protein [Snodgrassella communis]|uniref:RHS repeat domain-containing protein n=1 Tax=Snodgrassella communis TaxID=2946699 RepID=UPI001EF73319|nr:RHS repeat-associated core domain-containing protein [Snodgrassella communis]
MPLPTYNLIRCNQLLHFRSHHYRYDEHGRTQTKQTIGATQHYHYDADHRLTEVRIEQLNKTERYRYLYDALGRRIEKQKLDREGKPYNRTRFLWDGLRMIQETGPNHPTSLYIYTDQNSYEPLARIDKRGNDPERVMYFHTDLNGCPEELTDENGEILWECSFQLWGKRIHEIEHEPIEQNLRYQGQYLDRETGLHYNTFRYYDPDIGRFTQPDPIGLLGGLNLYQYAPNGLTWIDPLGWSCYFRGSKKGEPVSFKAKTGEYKIDKSTGLVKTTHGVSVFDNPTSVSSKGLSPHKIDMTTVNDNLKIIQRGSDPKHYEIVPSHPMHVEDYQVALSKIKVLD